MKVLGEKRPLVSESTVNRANVLDQFEDAKISRKLSADVLELSGRLGAKRTTSYEDKGAVLEGRCIGFGAQV